MRLPSVCKHGMCSNMKVLTGRERERETSCVGKLFTTILRNCWLSYMTTNGYLDSSVQKAFMKATPGCIKHQSKLAAILAEARKTHKSLTVCWLDLANAYGSVHHSLIQFSVQHYHAPAQFCNILQSLYSGLLGTIISVYQGDPLSVVISNTVINTFVHGHPTGLTRLGILSLYFPPSQPPTICGRHLHHCKQPCSLPTPP